MIPALRSILLYVVVSLVVNSVWTGLQMVRAQVSDDHPPPCTEINAVCGDHRTWREWPDVDHTAGIEVLHCARVHHRYDTGAGYDMSDASHTEIAVWFTLDREGKLYFLHRCGK